MPEPGLVSVVLSTFNGADRITAAIESVRGQTYSPWELLVAIDGSTDNTEALVSKLDDPRVKIVTLSENKGPSAARNAAIAVARGEFIAFIDDDDEWLPDKLARQIAALCADLDLGLVHGGVLDVMEDGRRLERIPPRAARSYKANLIRDCLALSTVVLRRSVIDRVGGFETSLRAFEDWDLWTRVLRLYPSDYVPMVVTIANQRSGSVMHGSVTSLARDRATVLRRRWRQIRAHRLGRQVLAYHHFFVGGLLLVNGRAPEARRRAQRSLRLRPSFRAFALYCISFAGGSITHATWRQLQRLRRVVRA